MTKKIETKARVVLTDWHNEPATHRQLNLLNRMLLSGESDRKRVSLPLTKGEAHDLIQKMKEAG
mgnify:CR=1 FL=1